MSQIIKAYLGIFLILFLTFTSAGILSAFLTVADAQDLHASMVSELENSDFYPGVLKNCFEMAEDCGYQLEVTLYREDYTLAECTAGALVPADTFGVTSARIKLTFPLRIAFFGVTQEHTFCAYAR